MGMVYHRQRNCGRSITWELLLVLILVSFLPIFCCEAASLPGGYYSDRSGNSVGFYVNDSKYIVTFPGTDLTQGGSDCSSDRFICAEFAFGEFAVPACTGIGRNEWTYNGRIYRPDRVKSNNIESVIAVTDSTGNDMGWFSYSNRHGIIAFEVIKPPKNMMYWANNSPFRLKHGNGILSSNAEGRGRRCNDLNTK